MNQDHAVDWSQAEYDERCDLASVPSWGEILKEIRDVIRLRSEESK